jgi:hypothetical protein
MSKKNERLIYMAEAHIISEGSRLDDNVKYQEKEDDKVVFCVWRNLIFRVIFSYKLIVPFFYTWATEKRAKNYMLPYISLLFQTGRRNILPIPFNIIPE